MLCVDLNFSLCVFGVSLILFGVLLFYNCLFPVVVCLLGLLVWFDWFVLCVATVCVCYWFWVCLAVVIGCTTTLLFGLVDFGWCLVGFCCDVLLILRVCWLV